jgi:hypothetical protein
METAMNHRLKTEHLELTPHQEILEFERSGLWPQLPAADQQGCRQALCQLLHQVISHQPEDRQDERED